MKLTEKDIDKLILEDDSTTIGDYIALIKEIEQIKDIHE